MRKLLLVILLVILAPQVFARSAVSISYGSGTQKLKAYRLAYIDGWRFKSKNNRFFDGYWELALTRFHKQEDMSSINVAGVVRLKFKLLLPWYTDIGFGIVRLTKDQFASRDLGSKLLFEERIGLGILLGREKSLEIGYRLMHFSNGYLANSNHGLNLHLAVIGYWF